MEKKELHTRDGNSSLISVWIQLAQANLVAGIGFSNPYPENPKIAQGAKHQ
jgi:hypothetical protein